MWQVQQRLALKFGSTQTQFVRLTRNAFLMGGVEEEVKQR
jgi:hypothetical protein